MAVVETISFQLRTEANEEQFLQADKQFQVEFTYQQPGIVRRTTARGRDQRWLALEIWESDDYADAAFERYRDSPIASTFMSFIDDDSVQTHRYTTVE